MTTSFHPKQFLSAVFITLVCIASFLPSTQAIRFELVATPGQGTERCLEQFVPKETLVNGFVDAPSKPFQRLDVTISDDYAPPNRHWSRPDANGEYKFSFTTHVDAYIKFCFVNVLTDGTPVTQDHRRPIHFRLDVGSDSHDFSLDAEKQKLEPHELELMRIEGVLLDMIDDMSYMENHNDDMHKVNESTMDRVMNFSVLGLIVVIGLGAWQVYYLHGFFKAKKLI